MFKEFTLSRFSNAPERICKLPKDDFVKNNLLKNMNVSFYMHCKISDWENEGIL